MALTTIQISSTLTTMYTSVGRTAVTFLSLCNTVPTNELLNLHIVKQGSLGTDANIVVKDLQVGAFDTFFLYQAGEKLILDDGDFIIASIGQSAPAQATAVISYMDI